MRSISVFLNSWLVVGLGVGVLTAVGCGSDGANGNASGAAGTETAGAPGAGSSSADAGANDSEGGATTTGGAPAAGGTATAGKGAGGSQAGGASTSTEFTDGPSAECLAALDAFEPCGGDIPDVIYAVGDVSCAPATTEMHGPGCPTAGSQQTWYEGGIGEISFSNGSAVSFSNAGAKLHIEGLSPIDCVKSPSNECTNTYFGAPTNPHGDCAVEGDNCHCNWYTSSSGLMGGGGGYTKDGTSLKVLGRTIPYCVKGDTITLDLAEAFPTAGKPFIVTATKK